jgi:hypothetical protein
MKLSDSFWSAYELDLQEVKIAYLNWAIRCLKEPPPNFKHLFQWEDQASLYAINSRYGRCFSISPFGSGVRGVPKEKLWKCRAGIDEFDLDLIARLSTNTARIRDSIRTCLINKDYRTARNTVLNYYWLKLGIHEMLFDRVYCQEDCSGRLMRGQWEIDDEDETDTISGLRCKIINHIRYGRKTLVINHINHLNTKLSGLSGKSLSTFLQSAMTWNRYAMCSFDCGPVAISKGSGFVSFNMIKRYMNKMDWPYQGTPHQILSHFYDLICYRQPPLCIDGSNKSWSLKSMKARACEIYEFLDHHLDTIHHLREGNQQE